MGDIREARTLEVAKQLREELGPLLDRLASESRLWELYVESLPLAPEEPK